MKTLGLCILASSIILAAAIVWHAMETAEPRYRFQASDPPGLIYIFDTETGEVSYKD